jgi:N-acetylmuramoyl-L-alanine amidase
MPSVPSRPSQRQQPDMRDGTLTGLSKKFLRAARHVLAWVGLIVLFRLFILILQNSPPVSSESPRVEPRILPGIFDTVIVDPGHGGSDEGASGHNLKEKIITLELAHRLVTRLNALGFTAILTREADEFVSLPQRVAIANAVPGAIFISLHCNSSDNAAAHGIEIYRCEAKSDGMNIRVTMSSGDAKAISDVENQLAQALGDSVMERLHAESRGLKTANFYVVRNVNFPSVLIECGFLSNAEDAKQLADEGYRDRLAQALAAGIAAYRSLVSPNGVKSVSTKPDSQSVTASR